MAFCLPKKYSNALRAAFDNGSISVDSLRKLSSEQRKNEFAKYVGEENAIDVNLKYESKVVLKDQKKAMESFVDSLEGVEPHTKKDMTDQIIALDKVFNPENGMPFLEDLAAKKLGATVTQAEARALMDSAKMVQQAKQAWVDDIAGRPVSEWINDPNNFEKRIQFGLDFIELSKKVSDMRGDKRGPLQMIAEIWNLPKQALTVADISATFVQLGYQLMNRRFYEGFWQAMKFMAKEENFQRLQAEIFTSPYYPLMQKGKLGISDVLSDKLNLKEEFLHSSLVEDLNTWIKDQSKKVLPEVSIPGVGKTQLSVPNVVRGSNRAFIGYVNFVRYKTFTDIADAVKLAGGDLETDAEGLRHLSDSINVLTGRGNIGLKDEYANAVPVLNMFLWTVRKFSANMQLFNPYFYVKSASPEARKYILKNVFGSLAIYASLYGLIRSMGGEAPEDPTHSRFGWFKLPGGHTWFNPGGPMIPVIRLMARIATRSMINQAGIEKEVGAFPNKTDADLIGRFLRGKANPTFGVFVDVAMHEDYRGNPVGMDMETFNRMIATHFVPLAQAAYADILLKENHTTSQILALTTLAGISAYTEEPLTRQGLTAWGDPIDFNVSDNEIDLDEKLAEIKQVMKFPPKKIKGVTLTDTQYRNYIFAFGAQVKQEMTAAVESGKWDAATPEQKLEGWNIILKRAKRSSMEAIALSSQFNNDGEDNDVFDKSQKEKPEQVIRER